MALQSFGQGFASRMQYLGKEGLTASIQLAGHKPQKKGQILGSMQTSSKSAFLTAVLRQSRQQCGEVDRFYLVYSLHKRSFRIAQSYLLKLPTRSTQSCRRPAAPAFQARASSSLTCRHATRKVDTKMLRLFVPITLSEICSTASLL